MVGFEKICEELYPRMLALGYDVTVYCRSYYVPKELQQTGKPTFNGVGLKVIPMLPIRGLETFIYAFLATVQATFSDADVIHFHTQGPTLFSAIPAWLAPDKAIVYTCNGIDWQRDKWGRIARWIIRSGEQASAKYPHVKIAVSDSLIEHYQTTYPGLEMRNIPNGVFPLPAVPLEEGLTDKNNDWGLVSGRYFMFCGRLVPEKAPENLIKAFLEIDTDAKLVIVGDSADTDDYVASIKAMAKHDSRVIFTGYQYGEALQALFSNALAYVTASKLEGLPLTLLEAMSFGLPIGVSNIGPHTEVLARSPKCGMSFDVQGIDDCRTCFAELGGKANRRGPSHGASGQTVGHDGLHLGVHCRVSSPSVSRRTGDGSKRKQGVTSMRIAIVNKFLFVNGGQESVMLDEAQWLSDAGHTVALFGMDHPRNLPDLLYKKYFVEYVDFSMRPPDEGSEPYDKGEKLKLAKNFMHNAEAAGRFEAFLNDFKPDIIHAHGIAHQLTTSIFPVATKLGIPLVQTLHDYQIVCPNYTLLIPGDETKRPQVCSDTKCFGGQFINAVTNKCVKGSVAASLLSATEMQMFSHRYPQHVNRFIAPSHFMKQMVLRAGIPSAQCTVLPNVYASKLEPDFKFLNGQPRSGFVYLGRLAYEKRPSNHD